MYSGVIPLMIGMPSGSNLRRRLRRLLPIAALLVRISVEERFLRETSRLPGLHQHVRSRSSRESGERAKASFRSFRLWVLSSPTVYFGVSFAMQRSSRRLLLFRPGPA